MADDEEQKQLELECIKLSIDFLKHITTLSGAATVILLALVQQPELSEGATQGLGAAAVYFGISAFLAMARMWWLLTRFTGLERISDSLWLLAIFGLFGSGLVNLFWSGFGLSYVLFAALGLVILAGTWMWFVVRIRRRLRPRDSSNDRAKAEPE